MRFKRVKIGTRGSPLALRQAHEVRGLLATAHTCDEETFEIVTIRTTGDTIQDRALSEAGGKGLFTKEIDVAMLDGSIDIAVHSSKDLPTILPDGIMVPGYLPREDVRDAFISSVASTLMDMPHGASLGSASLRRRAQVSRLRPDIKLELLRGNVETRLGKAESADIGATLLAYAGLKRLSLAHRVTALLETTDFLPAVGQGAIGLTARSGDHASLETIEPIIDNPTAIAVSTERAFLKVLDGSCRTPIAGLATLQDGTISFRGQVLREDGSETFDTALQGPTSDAVSIGEAAGNDILKRLPAGVLGKRDH